MPEVHGSRVDDSVTIGPLDAVRGIDTDPVGLAVVAQRSRELGVEIVSVADRTVKQHHGSGVACFTGTPIQALVAADGLGLPSAGAHHDGQHGDDGGRPRLRSRHHCEGAGGSTDAPICQDTPSGGLDDLLTSAEVGHDALVNLSRQEAFQAADDVAFGPASGEASGDVVAGRLVELHPDDDGSIEGRVGVSVAASIEAVPTGGHPRRGRDRAGAAELREGGLRTNPVGGYRRR